MNEYAIRAMTAIILITLVITLFNFEYVFYVFGNLVMILTLIEYQELHRKILSNFFPNLRHLNDIFVTSTTNFLWVTILGVTFFIRLSNSQPLSLRYTSFDNEIFTIDIEHSDQSPNLCYVTLPITLVVILYHCGCKISLATQRVGKLSHDGYQNDKEAYQIFNYWMVTVLLEIIAILLFGFSMSCLSLIYTSVRNRIFILIGLGLIFQTDHGALFIGRRYGKTQISEFFSHKTREGAFGGVVFAIVTGQMFKILTEVYLTFSPSMSSKTQESSLSEFHNISHLHYFVLSLYIAGTSILGDLFESFLKRLAKVKDSGTLLPGHGGVFDRMDSVFMSAPFLYYLTL